MTAGVGSVDFLARAGFVRIFDAVRIGARRIDDVACLGGDDDARGVGADRFLTDLAYIHILRLLSAPR